MEHQGLKRFPSRPDEYRIIRIPADPNVPKTIDNIPATLDALKKSIGGGWIEIVHTPLLPRYDGVQLIMIVDEEGAIKRLPVNARASEFYPGPHPIHGDVVLVGEALVADEEQYYEPDIVGIPASFSMIGVRA